MKRSSRLRFKSWITAAGLIAAALFPQAARAASCCGGGVSFPSLISGDERAQINSEVSYSEITADVTTAGIWRPRETAETTTSMRLSGAVAAFDRWQFGASAPVLRRARGGSSETGVGDLTMTAGYEIWTDWDYSEWRPKLIGFFGVTAPTGRSVQDATAEYKLDSRGRGFWAATVGLLARKTLRAWDLFSSIDIHQSFAKDSASVAGGIPSTIREIPGVGGSFALGAGYSIRSTRIGVASTWTYEDPVRIEGAPSGSCSLSRLAALTLSLAQDISDPIDPDGPPLSIALSYADQTRLGAPANTSLAKTLSLNLTRRWAR